MSRRRRAGRRRRLVITGLVLVVVAAAGIVLFANPRTGLWGEPVDTFTHVHGLDFPDWADHPFLATHRGLLVVDETGSWRYASAEAHDLMGFSAHPGEEDVLYASGHPAPGSRFPNPVGFLVSTDAGRSWEIRSLAGEADFHAMAVGPGGRVVYGWNVSGDPGLYRSESAGESWERLDAAELWEAGGVFSLAVDPADPLHVAAGTEGGLLRSNDAGGSWEVLAGGSPVTAVEWAEPDRIIAYVASPEAGLVASADDGDTWEPLGPFLPGDAVGHIAAHPTNPEILYLGTLGEALLRTEDGGLTWVLIAVEGARLETPQPLAGVGR